MNKVVDYKKLIIDIAKTLNYCINYEKDYGDDYTCNVLQDIVDKFELDEFL